MMVAHWAAAVLYNGLARYEEAASAAREVTANAIDPWESMWALPELVEAAARVGDTELARDALNRLAETTQPAGTEFALGIEARCSGAAERRRRRRGALPRIDRSAQPYATPSGARPRASALRGVAAPRRPTFRRARAAAHGPRHVRRDRHGGVRRARPP